jgi:hypothetical protein
VLTVRPRVSMLEMSSMLLSKGRRGAASKPS